MLVRNIGRTPSFLARDHTLIREVLHPKQGEVDLPYSLAHATLEPGRQSSPHRLVGHTEVYVIESGRGTVVIDGEQAGVQAGDLVFIPDGAEQYIRNDSPHTKLEFLCVVAPPYRPEEDILSNGLNK